MLHCEEEKVMRDLWTRFDDAYGARVGTLLDIVAMKGQEYDVVAPVWHKTPFGLLSFADEVYRKAGRLVSLLSMPQGERDAAAITDTLLDAAVWALFALAWQDIGGE